MYMVSEYVLARKSYTFTLCSCAFDLRADELQMSLETYP